MLAAQYFYDELLHDRENIEVMWTREGNKYVDGNRKPKQTVE